MDFMDFMDARNFAERLSLRGSCRLARAFLDAFDAAVMGQVSYAGGHAWLGPSAYEARPGVDAFGSTASGDVWPWVAA